MKTLLLCICVLSARVAFLSAQAHVSVSISSSPGLQRINRWQSCLFRWNVTGSVNSYAFNNYTTGKQSPLSSSANMSVNAAKGQYSLNISNVQPWDAGNYSLTVNVGSTSRTDTNALLFVFSNTQSSVYQSSGRTPASVGDTVELTCVVNSSSLPPTYRPPMNYSWFTYSFQQLLTAAANGSFVTPSGALVNGYNTKAGGKILVIKAVQYSDGQGIYCHGNESGSSSSSVYDGWFFMQLIHGPVITSFTPYSKKFNAPIGQEVTLTVSYAANPPTTNVKWTFKSNNGGSSSNLQSTFYSSGYAQLGPFSLSSISGYGNYTVTLTSSQGTSSQTFQVLPPGPPDSPTNFSVYFVTHLSIQLQWTGWWDNGCQQYFMVVLRQVNGNLQIDSQNVTGYTNSYNSTNTVEFINNVKPETKYQVTLWSMNALGNSSQSLTLTLTTPKQAQLIVSSDNISFSGPNVTIDFATTNANLTSGSLTVQCCANLIPFCATASFYLNGTATNRVVVTGVQVSTEYVLNLYLINGYGTWTLIALVDGLKVSRPSNQ